MANITNCAHCSEPIGANTDKLACHGACGKDYHFACLATSDKHYKKCIIQHLMHIPNLKWYCNECVSYTMDGAFAGVVDRLKDCAAMVERITQPLVQQQQQQQEQSQYHSAASSLESQSTSSGQSHTVRQQQQRIVSSPSHLAHSSAMDVSNEMTMIGVAQSLDDMVADTNGSRNATNTNTDSDTPTASNKRKLSQPTLMAKRLKTLSTVDTHINLSDMTLPPSTEEKYREVYVSRFKPSTEPADIIRHLNNVNGLQNATQNIGCTKLAPLSGRKISFVSFKLQVPYKLFEVVMSRSTWPQRVTVNEFVQRPKLKTSATHTKYRKMDPNGRKSKKDSKNEKRSKNSFRRQRGPLPWASKQIAPPMPYPMELYHPYGHHFNYMMGQPMFAPMNLNQYQSVQNRR